MTRGISLILAVGLVVLWLVGLSRHATPWLTWLNGVGALCAFGIAGVAGERMRRGFATGTPVALAIGLGVLWIIGLATHAVPWLVWWTFAFACAFLLLGVGGGVETRQIARPKMA
jgi:hypothetical protein